MTRVSVGKFFVQDRSESQFTSFHTHKNRVALPLMAVPVYEFDVHEECLCQIIKGNCRCENIPKAFPARGLNPSIPMVSCVFT